MGYDPDNKAKIQEMQKAPEKAMRFLSSPAW
jgi:hypothetical protein